MKHTGDVLSFARTKGKHRMRARKRLKIARKEASDGDKVRIDKARDKSKRDAVQV